ncbi:MAG TPA: hypothetical protein VFP50_12390 [Anaeromyxobacteraceae bacterium]|nr:hypothetical protein [Anaeromyxobacteraceae bacterium]
MRRPLALLVCLIASTAGTARGLEPLDLDLGRLGAPSAAAWQAANPGMSQADADALAAASKTRFALLSSELALAFSSPLLQPASTTGHSGFAFDLETGYAQVHHGVVGQKVGAVAPVDYWPTHALTPNELFLTSAHVRKAFPFSVELGGRLSYLSQSSYYAAQLEGKWAPLEGLADLPDVALRVAWQKVLGLADLDLSTTELDVLVSKRFGVNAVTSVTPYGGARFTLLRASTPALRWATPDSPTPATPGTPAQVLAGSAAFPNVGGLFYRTTAGVRLTSYAVSLAAEATYYAGGSAGSKSPGADDYPKHYVKSSLTGSFRFGFEF